MLLYRSIESQTKMSDEENEPLSDQEERSPRSQHLESETLEQMAQRDQASVHTDDDKVNAISETTQEQLEEGQLEEGQGEEKGDTSIFFDYSDDEATGDTTITQSGKDEKRQEKEEKHDEKEEVQVEEEEKKEKDEKESYSPRRPTQQQTRPSTRRQEPRPATTTTRRDQPSQSSRLSRRGTQQSRVYGEQGTTSRKESDAKRRDTARDRDIRRTRDRDRDRARPHPYSGSGSGRDSRRDTRRQIPLTQLDIIQDRIKRLTEDIKNSRQPNQQEVFEKQLELAQEDEKVEKRYLELKEEQRNQQQNPHPEKLREKQNQLTIAQIQRLQANLTYKLDLVNDANKQYGLLTTFLANLEEAAPYIRKASHDFLKYKHEWVQVTETMTRSMTQDILYRFVTQKLRRKKENAFENNIYQYFMDSMNHGPLSRQLLQRSPALKRDFIVFGQEFNARKSVQESHEGFWKAYTLFLQENKDQSTTPIPLQRLFFIDFLDNDQLVLVELRFLPNKKARTVLWHHSNQTFSPVEIQSLVKHYQTLYTSWFLTQDKLLEKKVQFGTEFERPDVEMKTAESQETKEIKETKETKDEEGDQEMTTEEEEQKKKERAERREKMEQASRQRLAERRASFQTRVPGQRPVFNILQQAQQDEEKKKAATEEFKLKARTMTLVNPKPVESEEIIFEDSRITNMIPISEPFFIALQDCEWLPYCIVQPQSDVPISQEYQDRDARGRTEVKERDNTQGVLTYWTLYNMCFKTAEERTRFDFQRDFDVMLKQVVMMVMQQIFPEIHWQFFNI